VVAFQKTDEQKIRAEFLEIFPSLKRTLKSKFRDLRSEEQSEAVSEAIALAFAMWLNARRHNRPATLFSVSHYSSLAVRSGRRLAGGSPTDALSNTRRARPRVTHISQLSSHLLDELLAERRARWPVVDRVAFRIDWSAFQCRQPRRTRRIMGLLAQGYRRCEVAEILRVSRPAITQRMNKAKQAWKCWIGEPTQATPRLPVTN